MNIWDDVLTERDKEVFAASGYGARMGFGKRPVLCIVDVNYNFIGDKPEPIVESIKRWRNSCGEEGWVAVEYTAKLIEAARKKNIPVIYSTGLAPRRDGFEAGRWKDKNARQGEDVVFDEKDLGNQIPDLIAPKPQDMLIRKGKPSAFYGTLLQAFLNDLQADSLIVTGTTTSGCVRATVIDAFSANYKVSVIEECTFDRGQTTHKINLFDMSQKYADIIKLDEAIGFINSLPDNLFEGKMHAGK